MIRRVIAPAHTPGGRSGELAGFRLRRKARLPRAKAFTQATCAASISLTNERELRTTQSAIIDAVCPRGFPMQSDALAARAFKRPGPSHDHHYECCATVQEDDAE